MLFRDEAQLKGLVKGSSTFAAEFQLAGPHDSKGRSLRQLDLKTRLFRYPCSFLIYSDAFEALRGFLEESAGGLDPDGCYKPRRGDPDLAQEHTGEVARAHRYAARQGFHGQVRVRVIDDVRLEIAEGLVLRELHRGGMTLLVVTHEVRVSRAASRVLVLRDGALAADPKLEASA